MKKSKKVIAMALAVAMATSVVPQAEAATVRLNRTKATLSVGKSVQLKVKGAVKGKIVKWSTKNKKVVTVSKKGKVTAKKIGKTKVIANVGKKKLICTITVKKQSGPVLIATPFVPNAGVQVSASPSTTGGNNATVVITNGTATPSVTATAPSNTVTAAPTQNINGNTNPTNTSETPSVEASKNATATPVVTGNTNPSATPKTTAATNASQTPATTAATNTSQTPVTTAIATPVATPKVTASTNPSATPKTTASTNPSATPKTTAKPTTTPKVTAKPTATPARAEFTATKVTQVSEGDYTSMDSCTSDKAYIYVLKHSASSSDGSIMLAAVTGSAVVQTKTYTIDGVTDPNGITYYNGYLYIANCIEKATKITRIKVDGTSKQPLGDKAASAKIYNKEGKNEGFFTPEAITYMFNHKPQGAKDSTPEFMMRGSDGMYYVFEYNETENAFKNLIECKFNGTAAAYNFAQDISYKNGDRQVNSDNGYLYVATWNKSETTTGKADECRNNIVRYTVQLDTANKTCNIVNEKEYDSNAVIRMDGTTEFNKFEVEGTCFCGDTMYYVINGRLASKPDDSSSDYLYSYKTGAVVTTPTATPVVTPTTKPSATPTVTATVKPSATPQLSLQKVANVTEDRYTDMQSCATDGKNIYILKNKVSDDTNLEYKYRYSIFVYSIEKKEVVKRVSYVYNKDAVPTGITYFDGSLYVALGEKGQVDRIALDVKNTESILPETVSKAAISTTKNVAPTAITYMYEDNDKNHCFMMRGKDNKYYSYTLNTKTGKFENEKECTVEKLAQDVSLYDNLQDISYKDGDRNKNADNGYLYVATSNGSGKNKIVRYTVENREKLTTAGASENLLRINDESSQNYDVKGTCFVGDELYYTVKATKDNAEGSLYKAVRK